MGRGNADLHRVRAAIAELVRNKCHSDPRTWSDIEATRYRNLCELEDILLGVNRLDAAS